MRRSVWVARMSAVMSMSFQGAVATLRPAASRHPEAVAAGGRMVWQAMFGYHLRTLVEACFSRYKHVVEVF